jgi:hypothetical protein
MQRRKFVIGMGALASGAAASVGTGAFTAMQADGREANINVVSDENALIGLEAGTTDLVTGTSDGQLAINFNLDEGGDGVNPNSTYQVGGLGDVEDLHWLVDGSSNVPTVDQIAIDTETSIKEEYAFKLLNQSGEDRAVELTYVPDEDHDGLPGDTTIYMVAVTDDDDAPSSETREELATAASKDRDGSILFTDDAKWSADLGSGSSAYVTILVNVDGVDPDEADLSGEIVVRAGSHDDFTEDDL